MKVSPDTLCKIFSEREGKEADDAYLNVEASRRGSIACCEMFGCNSTSICQFEASATSQTLLDFGSVN